MDWFYTLNGIWIFAIFCALFMAIMMFGCFGMRFRSGHGGRSCHGRETPRDIVERRYASGEIGKDQYDTMRRELVG